MEKRERQKLVDSLQLRTPLSLPTHNFPLYLYHNQLNPNAPPRRTRRPAGPPHDGCQGAAAVVASRYPLGPSRGCFALPPTPETQRFTVGLMPSSASIAYRQRCSVGRIQQRFGAEVSIALGYTRIGMSKYRLQLIQRPAVIHQEASEAVP